MALLEVKKLGISFGGLRAVDDFSIKIEKGDIYVSAADCPDHTCMKTGKLSQSGVPIVCLPNKLIIRYKEGADTDAA